MRLPFITAIAPLFLLAACGSDGDDKNANNNTGGNSSNTGGSGSGAGRPTSVGGGPMHSGTMFAGAECPDVGLPAAYALTNVQGAVSGSNVRITFDPQGDAKDYRVYALPAKADVSGSSVKGATYRCAGGYAVPFPAVEEEIPQQWWVRTRVTTPVKEYKRSLDDATLGYVYTTPADDRLAVYAVGDPNPKADNAGCYYMRWPETRVKRYTTDKAEHDDLVSKRWRDDGIVFYVPKPGAEGSEPIYWATQPLMDYSAEFHFKGGAEFEARKSLAPKEQFSVYTEAKDGAEPLMRVFYEQVCGRGHDELVAGLARFNKAYLQGAQPVPELHFSGLTEETTLVVEALDASCPFQGVLAPTSRPSTSEPFGDMTITYPAYQTPAELAKTSDAGELFVHGEGDGTQPKAISRACIKVKPEKLPDMDWRYDGTPETFSEGTYRNYQIYETESANFNAQFTSIATDEWSIGTLFGEIWATYSDKAADTNGKLRITPKARATLAADTFVHATMEVDAISSQRRYPQILISTAEVPVQDNLKENTTIVVQLFGGVTEALEGQIEFCDHRNWDVNDQCPKYPLYMLKDKDGEFLAPTPEINGLLGIDRTLQFDVYASTQRVYFYTNGSPYGCVDLPAGKLPAGPATVTYGDVLYHSAVDLEKWYPFHIQHMQVVTSRHFSNLGFSSNVPAPAWDETLVPCVPVGSLK